jgi:hypothetical protein
MDLNFGYNDVGSNQYGFTAGNGASTPVYGYNPLQTFGQGLSPTSGSVVDGLGGTIGNGSTSSIAGVTNAGDGAGSLSGSLGMNVPTFQLGLQGLSSLASMYTGLKALGLAKDQFAFQKSLATKNLQNSVTSYNTSLSDRANSRAVMEGQSTSDRDAYINANKLSA